MVDSPKSLSRNYLFSLLQQFVSVVLPLVTVPYLSRVLGPEGLGIVAFSGSIVQYFTLFGGLGLALYGNRAVAQVRDDLGLRSQTFWEIFTLRATFTTGALLCFLLSLLVFKPNHLEVYLVQSILILSAALDLSWLYMALEDFRKIAIRNVVIRIIGLILIFLLVRKSGDFVKYALIAVITELLGQGIYWIKIKELVQRPHCPKLKWEKHLAPTLALFAPQLAIQVYVVLDKTMLGLLSGVAEVGLYAQPEKIIKTLLVLITTLGTVMLPRMSHLYASGKESEFKTYAIKSLLFTSYGTFLLAGIAYATGSTFIPLFLGERFSASSRVFQILSPIIVFIGISNVLGVQMLISMGKGLILSFSVISGALANFSGNVFLIPKYGAIGAAISTVGAEFLVTATLWGFLRKSGFFRDIYKDFFFFSAAGGAGVLAGVLLGLLPISPWSKVGLSCFSQTFVYVLILHLVNSQTQQQVFALLFKKKDANDSNPGN